MRRRGRREKKTSEYTQRVGDKSEEVNTERNQQRRKGETLKMHMI